MIKEPPYSYRLVVHIDQSGSRCEDVQLPAYLSECEYMRQATGAAGLRYIPSFRCNRDICMAWDECVPVKEAVARGDDKHPAPVVSTTDRMSLIYGETF